MAGYEEYKSTTQYDREVQNSGKWATDAWASNQADHVLQRIRDWNRSVVHPAEVLARRPRLSLRCRHSGICLRIVGDCRTGISQ
jgi:hypothetical protein